jgi:hypothetical protein
MRREGRQVLSPLRGGGDARAPHPRGDGRLAEPGRRTRLVPPRTNWTRLVPPPVLTGHVSFPLAEPGRRRRRGEVCAGGQRRGGARRGAGIRALAGARARAWRAGARRLRRRGNSRSRGSLPACRPTSPSPSPPPVLTGHVSSIPRTNWTRLVPPPVQTGHVSSPLPLPLPLPLRCPSRAAVPGASFRRPAFVLCHLINLQPICADLNCFHSNIKRLLRRFNHMPISTCSLF